MVGGAVVVVEGGGGGRDGGEAEGGQRVVRWAGRWWEGSGREVGWAVVVPWLDGGWCRGGAVGWVGRWLGDGSGGEAAAVVDGRELERESE